MWRPIGSAEASTGSAPEFIEGLTAEASALDAQSMTSVRRPDATKTLSDKQTCVGATRRVAPTDSRAQTF